MDGRIDSKTIPFMIELQRFGLIAQDRFQKALTTRTTLFPIHWWWLLAPAQLHPSHFVSLPLTVRVQTTVANQDSSLLWNVIQIPKGKETAGQFDAAVSATEGHSGIVFLDFFREHNAAVEPVPQVLNHGFASALVPAFVDPPTFALLFIPHGRF